MNRKYTSLSTPALVAKWRTISSGKLTHRLILEMLRIEKLVRTRISKRQMSDRLGQGNLRVVASLLRRINFPVMAVRVVDQRNRSLRFVPFGDVKTLQRYLENHIGVETAEAVCTKLRKRISSSSKR